MAASLTDIIRAGAGGPEVKSGIAAVEAGSMFAPGRLDQLRAAAGLQPQGDIRQATAESLTSAAEETYVDPSETPLVQDLSALLQGIKSRQAQTSANLQAIDTRDSDDLGSAPTAQKTIADQLSDLSKDLSSNENQSAMEAAAGLSGQGELISGSDTTDDAMANQQAQTDAAGTTSTTTEATTTTQDGDLGAMGLDGAPGDEGPADPFEGILKKAMDSVAEARGEKPKKDINDYKEEFALATGVDISGKPDKSQALMALGLSLMQNKAGRGFNVSNMLGAIGEAGEKAMPEFAKAKAEARNAQIAAGKFGLQQVAADKAAKAAKVAARQKVVDELLKSQLDSVEAAKLEGTKHLLKMKQIELENDAKVSAAQIEAGGKPTEYGSVMNLEDKAGLPGFVTRKARNKSTNVNHLMAPEDEIVVFGDALSDVNEGLNAGATMARAVEEAMRAPGGITGQRGMALIEGWGRSIGMGINLDEEPIFETKTRTVKDENGNERTEEYQVMTGMKKNPTPLSGLKQADAIRDRLISQFKRFLTQETGNGISNVDIANIERLLGKANFLDDPEDALFRLKETMKIFESKRQKINNRLEMYMDKDAYRTEDEYNKSMDRMNQAISRGYNLPENIFADFGDDNVTIDPGSGLQVFKMY